MRRYKKIVKKTYIISKKRIVLSTALIILSSAVNAEIVLRELVMAVRN